MPNSEAFVQSEPWFYQSPRLLQAHRKIDMGLIAEAMIFYDTVYVGHTNDEHFARIVAWFKGQAALSELIALLNDRVLVPYYYAFHTLPGEKNDIWFVYNIQDEEAGQVPVFQQRILHSARLGGLVRRASERSRLEDAAMRHHIEVKAADFGAGLENARLDYQEESKAAFLVQIVVDELYRDLGLAAPPTVEARITKNDNGTQTINWNIDFDLFRKKLGPELTFHRGSPLAGAAYGAKTLWSAAQLGADLYIASPLMAYADYKLDEGNKAARSRAIMQELIAQVAFPDIRELVNRGEIGVAEILLLRRKAARFREWLRSESQFDRNAVIAYLGELATESGWKNNVSRMISAVGLFGGAVVGAQLAGPLGVAGGALAGGLVSYVGDLAAKLDAGWRPKVFGDFAQATVERAKAQRK